MARKKNFDEQEILERALNLFWRKGYNATSVQDLVDELGINRASIYDTWGDKHQLYLASLKYYRHSASSWLLNEIRSEKPAIQVIENFMNHIVESVQQDHENKGCFMVNAIAELANLDIQVHQLASENRKTIEKVLTELIKEAQETGDFKNNKAPEALASFLFNTISGLRVICKSEVSKDQLQETVEIALDTLRKP